MHKETERLRISLPDCHQDLDLFGGGEAGRGEGGEGGVCVCARAVAADGDKLAD